MVAGYKGLTQAHAESNARYDAKTYKTMLFKLRLEDDAEIIESIQEAQEHGISKREWLTSQFDGSGISLRDVKSVLEKYGVDERIAEKMLEELSGK